MFVPFVNLALKIVFDILLEGILHAFPVHHSTEHFLESGCTGVLEVMAVPTYCLVLESSRKDHDHALTQDLSIFNKLCSKFMVTCQFKEMGVIHLSLRYLLYSEGVDNILLAVIFKHQFHRILVYCRLLWCCVQN